MLWRWSFTAKFASSAISRAKVFQGSPKCLVGKEHGLQYSTEREVCADIKDIGAKPRSFPLCMPECTAAIYTFRLESTIFAANSSSGPVKTYWAQWFTSGPTLGSPTWPQPSPCRIFKKIQPLKTPDQEKANWTPPPPLKMDAMSDSTKEECNSATNCNTTTAHRTHFPSPPLFCF